MGITISIISFVLGFSICFAMFQRAYHRYNSEWKELKEKADKRDTENTENQIIISKLQKKIDALTPNTYELLKKLCAVTGLDVEDIIRKFHSEYSLRRIF